MIQNWFQRSLNEYNFYILPVAFSYGFQTLSTIDLENKPEALANLLRSITAAQEEADSSDFHFVCELTTQLVSAKKFHNDADIIAKIDPKDAAGIIVVEKTQRLTDKYPLSYTQLWQRVKAQKPTLKQGDFNRVLKELGIKESEIYSSPSFGTKAQRERYEATGKPVPTFIYNEDALQLILNHLP